MRMRRRLWFSSLLMIVFVAIISLSTVRADTPPMSGLQRWMRLKAACDRLRMSAGLGEDEQGFCSSWRPCLHQELRNHQQNRINEGEREVY